MGYFEDKVAETEKEIETVFDEMINEDVVSIRELADKFKEDYMLLECMNCDNLYTCDNNWEDVKDTQLVECTMKKLLAKFKEQINKGV